jgi:diaphanous 2
LAHSLKNSIAASRNLRENLKPLCKIIKKISVCMAHKPINWLQEFNQSNGFSYLQDVILDCKTKYSTLYNNNTGSQYYNRENMNNTLNATLGGGGGGTGGGSGIGNNMSNQSSNSINYLSTYNNNEFKDKDTQLTKEIRFECMKILKSFVNTKYGINVVLENKTTITAIATAIDCNDVPSMNVACLILAGLALLDHEKVLIAIREAAKFSGKHRFYSIVKGLTINDDKELKTSCMILINTLIGNADCVDYKMHLRSDFARCGLVQALQAEKVKLEDDVTSEIQCRESSTLMKQFEIFEYQTRSNFEELDSLVENIETIWDEPKTAFEYLYNIIKDTPAEHCLLSIFQHLLFVRDDVNVRYAYYRLIEECVAKIVLFKEGRDPDFDCGSKFELDVESSIKTLTHAIMNDSTSNRNTFSDADAKKLEKAITERQEIDAKAQTLTKRLKLTEEVTNY